MNPNLTREQVDARLREIDARLSTLARCRANNYAETIAVPVMHDDLAFLRELVQHQAQEIAEHDELMALQHTRMKEATAHWHAAGNDPRAWPDLGQLLTFLLGRISEKNQELSSMEVNQADARAYREGMCAHHYDDPEPPSDGCFTCAEHERDSMRAAVPTMIHTLTNVAQILDGWHQDGTAWTAYDEGIRQEVTALLGRLYAPPFTISTLSASDLPSANSDAS